MTQTRCVPAGEDISPPTWEAFPNSEEFEEGLQRWRWTVGRNLALSARQFGLHWHALPVPAQRDSKE